MNVQLVAEHLWNIALSSAMPQTQNVDHRTCVRVLIDANLTTASFKG